MAPAQRTRAREAARPTWLAPAACVVLALALRAPYVGTALGADEGGIAFIARQWPGGHGSLYGAYWLDRPPLLVGLFRIVAPGGDAGVRALGAAAAVALVLAVWRLGAEVAGEEAGRTAALLAALLTGSVAIAAVFTPAELLAAVPSTLSVLCLLRRRLFAAGLLAVTALMIKQSFLDAGVAGLAFLIVSRRPRWWLEYAAGAAIPVAVLAAWNLPGYADALLGFRLQALHTLAGSDLPLATRLGQLAAPALASGLVVAVGAAMAGLRRLRDRVHTVTLAAWFAGAAVGVLAGGSYWPHYLIELVPVACVATAARRPRARALAACVALSLAAAVAGVVVVHEQRPFHSTLEVARYVRTHARPGDTQYVMYARANLLHYAGLSSPYPYEWSLMVRAKPGAIPELRRLLASSRRPTWLVEWQHAGAWGLDPAGETQRLLATRYRVAAVVAGHRIYHAS
jgi:hypothetical protein